MAEVIPVAGFNEVPVGLCDRCHDPIEADRLAANPMIRVCLGCFTEDEVRALERDLELASTIQVRLLPPPRVLVNGWEVGYHYLPAGPVSGDYCDVLAAEEPSGPAHFMLGDVSGKGVSASILMANLHAIFRSLVPLGLPLPVLAEQANRLFVGSTLPNSYATIVIGRLHATGALEIVNAGHPAPFLARDGELLELEATGLPLGLFGDARFETLRFDLSEGDLVVAYSDGVSEARDASKRPYGSQRIGELLAAEGVSVVDDVLRTSLDDLAAHRNGGLQEDDMTLLAVRRAVR